MRTTSSLQLTWQFNLLKVLADDILLAARLLQGYFLNHKIWRSILRPPALMVLTEHQNILYHQANILEVLAGDILPAAVWFAVKLSLVWHVKLVDDSGGVVIARREQTSKHSAEQWCGICLAGWLAGWLVFLAELLIGHKITPVHPLNGPEGTGQSQEKSLIIITNILLLWYIFNHWKNVSFANNCLQWIFCH